MLKTFQKGSSIYVCSSCGKRTRHVDPDNVSDDTCDDCYEWQGWVNAHSDGGHETNDDTWVPENCPVCKHILFHRHPKEHKDCPGCRELVHVTGP